MVLHNIHLEGNAPRFESLHNPMVSLYRASLFYYGAFAQILDNKWTKISPLYQHEFITITFACIFFKGNLGVNFGCNVTTCYTCTQIKKNM